MVVGSTVSCELFCLSAAHVSLGLHGVLLVAVCLGNAANVSYSEGAINRPRHQPALMTVSPSRSGPTHGLATQTQCDVAGASIWDVPAFSRQVSLLLSFLMNVSFFCFPLRNYVLV